MPNAPRNVKLNATLSLKHSEKTVNNNYRLFNQRKLTENGAKSIRQILNAVDEIEKTYDDVDQNMDFENLTD